MKKNCIHWGVIGILAVALFMMVGCTKKRDFHDVLISLRQRGQEESTNQISEELNEKIAKRVEESAVTEEVFGEEPQMVQEKQEQIIDLDDAYQTILDECTGEFIGYHLVDETFLTWLSIEYGSDCVIQIANEVIREEPDENIWYELTGNSIQVLWLMYCKQTGFQQYQLDRVTWKECASSDKTVLDFTGDVNFAEGYETTSHMDASPNGIYDCFSENLLAEMNQADVMMVNNEFTYSKRGTALPGKAFTFRADPKRVELMKTFGTDLLNLANNHVCDFGPEALEDTLKTIDDAGIPRIGAGMNLDEARKPYYFVCNGRKIAIVAATQIERSLNYTKEATETTPGVLKTLNPEKFVQVIREAERNSDYVIVYVHWGTEGDSNYGNDQVNLAKAFVNAGADAIIGGHTHCLQGCTYIDGVPVIYSLGNFWFSSTTLDTGLAQVVIDEDGTLSLRFIPCIQQNIRTSLVTDSAQKKRILDFMQQHSKGVYFTEEGVVVDASTQKK